MFFQEEEQNISYVTSTAHLQHKEIKFSNTQAYVITVFVMFSDSPPPGAPNTGLSTGVIAGIVVVVLVVVILAVAVIIMGVVWWRRRSGEFSCGSLAVLATLWSIKIAILLEY